MKKHGLDPYDKVVHEKFNRQSLIRFMKETKEMIEKTKPGLSVFFNGTQQVGARDFAPYNDRFEVESLAYGWGFLHMEFFLRFLRTLGRPVAGMTGRFHKVWGDFGTLPSEIQLKYECATMLANGATCMIGDHLHPDGKLDLAAYERIGSVYEFVQEREEWSFAAESVPYVAIMAEERNGGLVFEQPTHGSFGATKVMLESQFHFDIIDQFADLSKYKIIIIPDNEGLLPENVNRLKEFVSSGGTMVTTHPASLRETNFALADVIGVDYESLSPYDVGYVRITHDGLGQDLPKMDLVVHDRFALVRRREGTEELAKLIHPITYSEHYYKHQAPPSREESGYSAAVRHSYGRGTSIYFAAPLFRSYLETRNPVCR